MADSQQALADPMIQTHAAHLASVLDPRMAVVHAERACALAPNQQGALSGLAEAQLAAGDQPRRRSPPS